MKKAFLTRGFVTLLLIAISFSGASQDGLAAAKFVAGFEDLPLMPSMTGIPDTDVSFDTTAGRIIIAFARSPDGPETIRAFYRTVLSQLGWRKQTETAFTREDEVLSFDYLADGSDTVIRFSLLPQ